MSQTDDEVVVSIYLYWPVFCDGSEEIRVRENANSIFIQHIIPPNRQSNNITSILHYHTC